MSSLRIITEIDNTTDCSGVDITGLSEQEIDNLRMEIVGYIKGRVSRLLAKSKRCDTINTLGLDHET